MTYSTQKRSWIAGRSSGVVTLVAGMPHAHIHGQPLPVLLLILLLLWPIIVDVSVCCFGFMVSKDMNLVTTSIEYNDDVVSSHIHFSHFFG
jgi:hypothetical protein